MSMLGVWQSVVRLRFLGGPSDGASVPSSGVPAPIAYVLLFVMLVAAGCDRVPLLAPTGSTITVSASARILPTGSTTEITAVVIEESGTPVQNGTTVRFATSLGRVDPVEVQTRNGLAVTTFFAGDTSGVAQVSALSGAASGSGADTTTNVVQITIGAAAVDTVTIRASPGSVGPSGGSVELIVTVVEANGRTLEGVLVVFNVDQGTLSANAVRTTREGEARATLTTSQETVVSATAGTKTSSTVTITVRAGPAVSLSCAPVSGTGNCSAVEASTTTNTATVVFTIAKASGSSTLGTASIDFGDNVSQSLGNLAGGDATVTHTYNGPSGDFPRPYTASVTAVDINNERATVTTIVTITPPATPAQLAVTLSASVGTVVPEFGQPVTFTATVTPATGGADMVEKYEWEFGDGRDAETSGNSTTHVYVDNGRKIATVTVTTRDGRTATARAEFIISGITL